MSSNILILGFGISGQAAAKLALHLGASFDVADERDTPSLREAAQRLLPATSTFLAGWTEGVPLPSSDLIVASPGLSESSSPLLRAALRTGVPVISELEFGFRHLTCPVFAITGTNGKTTTTELTTCLLNAAGLKAEAAGNIGEGLSEAAVAAAGGRFDCMVVEASSFQLERVSTFAPKAAAVLNIASDHINRHGTLDAYAKVKFSIFDRMPSDSRARIVNANILDYWTRFLPPGLRPTSFSAELDADFSLAGSVIEFQGKAVFDMEDGNLKGRHNAENIMAALALVRAALGDGALSDERVISALSNFRAGDHRIEVFAERDGVKFIDDSKGTNPHAVVAAVESLRGDGKVCLLLGGLDKGMDFSPLASFAPKVRKAFLIGQCREKMLACLGHSFSCELYASFDAAVRAACLEARPGDAVMLSPACASMDMFKDYKDRGDTFKRLVCEWLTFSSGGSV